MNEAPWDTRLYAEIVNDLEQLRDKLEQHSMLCPEIDAKLKEVIKLADEELAGMLDANRFINP